MASDQRLSRAANGSLGDISPFRYVVMDTSDARVRSVTTQELLGYKYRTRQTTVGDSMNMNVARRQALETRSGHTVQSVRLLEQVYSSSYDCEAVLEYFIVQSSPR